jgi:hypothetical protein
LSHRKEEEPVDRPPDNRVQFPGRELVVADGDVLCQGVPPRLDPGQDIVINGCRPFPALLGIGIFVKGSFQDTVLREE